MKQTIKTVDNLKGLLRAYFDEMSNEDYQQLIKLSLGAWTIGKPKDLETCFNQIDAWINSDDKNKTTLESYGRAFDIKDIFYPDSPLFKN